MSHQIRSVTRDVGFGSDARQFVYFLCHRISTGESLENGTIVMPCISVDCPVDLDEVPCVFFGVSASLECVSWSLMSAYRMRRKESSCSPAIVLSR